MKGYTYILKCIDGSYYTGSTIDLERRLWQHKHGEGANFTKKRLPLELVYFEEYDHIDIAFNREKQIQGWSRKKKEALINERYEELPQLAKKIWRKYMEMNIASSEERAIDQLVYHLYELTEEEIRILVGE